MATITIDDGILSVEMSLLDRVLSLTSQLKVPVAHIAGVSAHPEEARQWFHGIKFGANVPGVITAGTFYTGDGKVFYDMHDAEQTIAIDLHDESYRRLIVQVDDPEGEVARIRAALR